MKEELFAGDLARRALHNTVQELRGNIRILVRVRPFLPGDAVAAAGADDSGAAAGSPAVPALADAPASAIACSPDGTMVTIQPPAPRGLKEAVTKRETKPATFTFDAVFPPAAGQADIFKEVSHLVQSALDGYQVCLFSYGQTGSGKTYTMQGARDGTGDSDLGEGAGLIPRSVRQILDAARRMEAQGWVYTLEASFLEVRSA